MTSLRPTGIDRAVLEARFVVGVFIIVALVGDLVGVVLDPHFPAVSGIELALAIGTLALAYAGATQVAVAIESRKQDLIWQARLRSDRLADIRPHLKFVVRDGLIRERIVLVQGTLRSDRIERRQSYREAVLSIENVGPGITRDVSYSITVRSAVDEPLRDSYEERVPLEDRLAVYEEHSKDLGHCYLRPLSSDSVPIFNAEQWTDNPETDPWEVAMWALVEAQSTDVDGNRTSEEIGGLTYDEPLDPRWDPPEHVALDVRYHESSSRWRLMRPEEIELAVRERDAWRLRKGGTGGAAKPASAGPSTLAAAD